MHARRLLCHTPLALAVVAAIAVGIDPHPFDGRMDTPRVVAAGARITPATATTFPPSAPGAGALPPVTTAPVPAPTLDSPPQEDRLDAVAAEPPPPLPPTGAPPSSGASAAAPPPSVIARAATSSFVVYPAEGARAPLMTLSANTEFGTPRVLLTTQLRGDWIQVLLPARPDGSTGWVRARDVALATVVDVISVDTAARVLQWTHADQVVMRVPVAIGAANSPTPRGTFFVTDVLPEDPNGPYGAWLLALNGHSDTFQTFDGRDARIAIHGTNAPSSIGGATSNGCVRVSSAPLALLAAAIAPGTPVSIS